MEVYNNELECRILRRIPRDGTEAKKVLGEVEIRKRIAKEKGLDRLIIHIYFGYIEHFFRWSCESINDYFKDSYPEVLSLLREIREFEYQVGDDTKFKSICLFLGEKQYRFDFREKSFNIPNEYCTHGLLELYKEDEKLFALNLSLDWPNNAYSEPKWRPFDIVAFIEGNWINDFEALKQAILQDNENKAVRKAEDSTKTDELKRNFGID